MDFNRKKLLLSSLATAAIASSCWILSRSEVGVSANFFIANRLEFSLREYFQKDPSIDARLKIFAFDDKTLASYKSGQLSMTDWARLIDTLAAQKPKTVIIDQMFSVLPVNDPKGVERFNDALKRSGNVVAAAFVHDYLITSRSSIAYDKKDFRLERYTDLAVESIHWMPYRSPNLYGPHPDIRDSFSHIGHALYPGGGRIDPFIRIGKNAVIPHVTLFTADKINAADRQLTVNGSKVSLDGNAKIPLNFSSNAKYYRAIYPVKALLADADAKGSTSLVTEGDIVLILPAFFTGNLDVLEGATTRVPGGFMLAAMLNSILSGNWLHSIDNTGALIVLTSIVGTAVGYSATAISFWPIMLGLLATILIGSLSAFIFLNTQIAWFYPTACFFVTSTVCYGVTMVERMLETQKLKDALRGAVPEAKLREIISNKGRLHLEASERVVTLMFLDIANFSIVSEQNTARDTFLYLKEVLRDITKIIHKYGGTVDRTLGDGILCFFGYSYDGEISENQADQAIRCAIEVQRQNIAKCIDFGTTGKTALPFRIGLNTSSVYIGDIGNEDRIDFTVIGNGVNYAQRLESACEHHSLMISGTTMDFSTTFNARMPGFKKRFINIKHHDELIESIEFNPFHDQPGKLADAHNSFRKTNNLERKEQRWPVAGEDKVTIETEFGPAELVDFSISGFCIQIKSYLARGVSFDLSLVFAQPELKKLASDFGINSIKAEVRWAKVSGTGFCHGIRITNLSDGQLENLFQFLRSTFNRNATDDVPTAA